MTCAITHVQQTLNNNCVSACLAMVLHRPIDEVTEAFHHRYWKGDIEIKDYLVAAGIPFRHCLAGEREFKPGHVYLVATPSINIPGGMHMMVIQVIDDGWFIFDPNEGRKGKTVIGSFPGGNAPIGYFQMLCFNPEFEFTEQDVSKTGGLK